MENIEALLDAFLKESPQLGAYPREPILALEAYQHLLKLKPSDQVAMALLVCSRYGVSKGIKKRILRTQTPDGKEDFRLRLLLSSLLRRKQAFRDNEILLIGQALEALPFHHLFDNPQAYFASTVKRFLDQNPQLPDALLENCQSLILQWSNQTKETLKWSVKLQDVIGADDFVPPLPLERNGEVFANVILDDLESMDPATKATWIKLLAHAADSDAGKPGQKWVAKARQLITSLGEEEVENRLCSWFPKINFPAEENADRSIRYSDSYVFTYDPMSFIEAHLAVLKGMAWIAGLINRADVARVVGAAGVSSYKKIPGVGPRATRVGNACVWALGNMGSDSALAQLALMKVKVKFGTAQKSIEKALEKLASKLGITTEELEEISVPEYGLTEVGRMEEPFGEFTAVLEVSGQKPRLVFHKPDGKPMKSVPAAVRNHFASELKELRGISKDLEKMLSAQKERLDHLFLLQKSWAIATWRERYLDHPVVGTLARRMIWIFHDGVREQTAIWLEGCLTKQDGTPLKKNEGFTVRIWHPVESTAQEIQAWRRFLFEHMIQQPFKQAHREVYFITDAEKATGVYSNRFASHVVKQHQFNSLCAARGWKNRLRLMVDDEYPPAYKELAVWGLRAEFWIEGIGDEYTDEYVLESGAFRYLSTDQVRFYRIEDAQVSAHASGGGYRTGYIDSASPEPVHIEEIPEIVLSEILRDVDLFVGVTSVGNDANWVDGGPEGRYREYWHHHSFGELGETAETRKEILASLLPRLTISDVSSIEGRFLKIKGKLRTYKIHLGSGNILMEPNDQYLCIVKAPSRSGGKEKLFLPFEGDDKLSVILSKAFLLAGDDKISDSTILSQIKR